uniref:BZIP domain-containing protein n=1 Tax=Haemonchus contortus TaxID=6289 RepID=A0A7I4YVY1_HAECO
MEKCASLKSKLGEAANEKSEQNPKELEKEIKELKRLVEIKTREVNRLGDLCDAFDEVEANYRTKVSGLIKENEKLKAQVQMLTPETTLVPSNDRVVITTF